MFFFFKQKTAYEMRISDWSSDVCSSDLHAPEVECISKGKARTPYEFGVKVSIATTLKEGLVVGARSMPGNPYDGHTLAEALEQAGIIAEHPIDRKSVV